MSINNNTNNLAVLNPMEMCKYTEQIEDLGPRYETLSLLDKLIEENLALKNALERRTSQLRSLQHAVDSYLMLPASESRAELEGVESRKEAL